MSAPPHLATQGAHHTPFTDRSSKTATKDCALLNPHSQFSLTPRFPKKNQRGGFFWAKLELCTKPARSFVLLLQPWLPHHILSAQRDTGGCEQARILPLPQTIGSTIMVQPEFPVRWRAPAPGRKHPGKALEHSTKATPQPPTRAGMLLWQQGKHHNRAQAGEQGKKSHQWLGTEAIQPGNGCG